MTKQTTQTGADNSGLIRVPLSLSFKDLVTVVSIAVSIALAWGVFSTRIAVLEQEVVELHKIHDRDMEDMHKLQQEVATLDEQLTNHIMDDGLGNAPIRPSRSRK